MAINTAGITCLQGLFDFKGPLKDSTQLLHIKQKCIRHFNMPLQINSHSWKNIKAHIYYKGTTLRATLLDLVVRQTGITLKVECKKKIIYVSPMHIMGVHINWLNNAAISDDEEDTTDYFNKIPLLHVFATESLRLLDEHSIKSLRTQLVQVNELVEMVFQHY